MTLITAFLFIFSFAQASDMAKPVSLSYTNIIACYPQLEDPTNSFKVDLNKLKTMIDRKITTTQSFLHHRIVLFKDHPADKVQKRLKFTRKGKTLSYELLVESLDANGVGTPLPLTQAQRINPKIKDMSAVLATATLISDDSFYDDTKIQGEQLSYRRSFNDILELQLSNPVKKIRLSCENQKDLGITCTCNRP